MSFAVDGLKDAFSKETSFRTQILAAFLAIAATSIIAPRPVWWAIILSVIALILATELINTALERALDGLHPQQAEFVKQAKDCAAAAVFLLSITSIVIFSLMLWETHPI